MKMQWLSASAAFIVRFARDACDVIVHPPLWPQRLAQQLIRVERHHPNDSPLGPEQVVLGDDLGDNLQRALPSGRVSRFGSLVDTASQNLDEFVGP
jgi:hypothetical protein